MSKQRNSSIELLKVIAIVMIVFSHAMPFELSSTDQVGYMMNLGVATTSIQRLIIVIFRYMGQLGNAIFIVCSSWFLTESRGININKIVRMIIDCFIISAGIMCVVLLMGYNLSLTEIMKQFVPITTNQIWFVTCYILFYLVHPALNLIINSLNQRKFMTINIVLAVLYCGFNFLIPGAFYYTRLVGFICIYFFVAYMKKYLKNISENVRVNTRVLIVSFVCFIAMVLVTDLIGLKINIFSNMLIRWNAFINPFFVLISLSLFNLFSRKIFSCKLINYISGLSLLIYIIHNNKLVMEKIKAGVFLHIYNTVGYEKEILLVIFSGIALLIGSVIISTIYKYTVQKLVFKLTDWFCCKVKKIYNS